jgi:hypothetical protein
VFRRRLEDDDVDGRLEGAAAVVGLNYAAGMVLDLEGA